MRRTGDARPPRRFAPIASAPLTRLRIALAAVVVLAAAAFAGLVVAYERRWALVRLDADIAGWLDDHRTHPLVVLFHVVTFAGDNLVLWTVVVVAAVLLARARRIGDAALLLVSAAGLDIVNRVLKADVHRPRPGTGFLHLNTFSFPSGHAAGSSAVYAVIGVMLARRLDRRLAVAYAALVAVVCFSRLYLGVHYLSDVLAGLALGLGWAAATLLVYFSTGRRVTHTNSVASLANGRRSNQP
jgi:undecaprenyl-diphosphatase